MAKWFGRGGLIAVLALGVGVSVALAATSPSQPLTGRVPGKPARGPQRAFSNAGDQYRIVIEPSLSAGYAGWESFLSYSLQGRLTGGGGGGGGYPTKAWPFFGGGAPTPYTPGQTPRGDTVDYVLTGPDVAAIRLGTRTIRTINDPGLPTDDRAAVFFERAAAPAAVLPFPGGGPRKALRILPLDASGRVIRTRLPSEPFVASRFWQAPSAVTPNIQEPPYHGPTHRGRPRFS